MSSASGKGHQLVIICTIGFWKYLPNSIRRGADFSIFIASTITGGVGHTLSNRQELLTFCNRFVEGFQCRHTKCCFSSILGDAWTAYVLLTVSDCGMKNRKRCKIPLIPDEIIGHFGQVLLVRKWNGWHDLIGGTEQERGLARRWCAVYAPFLLLIAPLENHLVLSA